MMCSCAAEAGIDLQLTESYSFVFEEVGAIPTIEKYVCTISVIIIAAMPSEASDARSPPR